MTTLVADIGGTNARFALSEPDGALHHISKLRVADHPRFEDALRVYLDSVPQNPTEACLAVAGPSDEGRVAFTNSPWVVEGAALERALGLGRCMIVNDFQALSRFAALTTPQDVVEIKSGEPLEGAPILTIGPGTGLGQGLLVPTPARPLTIPTEGGHVVLPAVGEAEAVIVEGLSDQLGRTATAEDAVSGPGLELLYQVMAGTAGEAALPATAAEITAAALKEDGPARRCVRQFCLFLATVASNSCLGTGARGGVLIAGGIPPRILPLIQDSGFAERFVGTSKMRHYTEDVPVRVLTADSAALRGAAALLTDDGHARAVLSG
ncbi:glucokinase [Parvularcula oceani]|uniref:glucokinase n=1 Tax=Parvularcula oceani TaxID=1247963 RepID=UPI00068A3122|nr:glucokinase [Parvularcula oceani]